MTGGLEKDVAVRSLSDFGPDVFDVGVAGATSTHYSGLVRTILPGSESKANAHLGSLEEGTR